MSFGSGTAASEGAGKHPNGDYAGIIVKVDGKYYEEQPLYEVHIKTNHGRTKKTIWGFTDQDQQMCNPDSAIYDQDHCQRTMKSIAGTKRMLIDLGLVDDSTVKGMGWDDLISAFIWRDGKSALVGKHCHVVLMDHQNGSGKQIVFINAPRGNGQAPAKGKGKQAPPKQQQAQPPAPPQELQPAPDLDVSSDGPPDLDGIPY